MDSMIVLTVKRDGGTQDVVGFYSLTTDGLDDVMDTARKFLAESCASRRAIARIEATSPAKASFWRMPADSWISRNRPMLNHHIDPPAPGSHEDYREMCFKDLLLCIGSLAPLARKLASDDVRDAALVDLVEMSAGLLKRSVARRREAR